LPGLVGYGLVLGLMNLLIYQAFERIPVGIAVGLEVTGPLAVALLGSRRWTDFAWLLLAVTGLVMLLPLKTDAALDPVGVACAGGAGFCWALYIVFGKRVSASMGRDAVSWGMLIAAIVVVPLGVVETGTRLAHPSILLAGLVIAALSSALPYSIEMKALRLLPSHVFGLVVSTAPAIAALAAFLVLDERLAPQQWLALFCIIAASAACVLTAARKKPA
jgi:inner membrane transporter RhtA